jgi:hypothetical protein
VIFLAKKKCRIDNPPKSDSVLCKGEKSDQGGFFIGPILGEKISLKSMWGSVGYVFEY